MNQKQQQAASATMRWLPGEREREFVSACANGDHAAVESFLAFPLWLENGWGDAAGDAFLETAVENGQVKIVERLLQDHRFTFDNIFFTFPLFAMGGKG